VQASNVNGHAHTRSTRFMRAILARTRNLALVIHLVVLEHCKLDRLVVMLGLLGLGVSLLLPLLGTTAQTQHQVQRAFLLDIVVGERAAVFELLACKDQTLLVRRNALLVLDLGLDIVNAVRGLHIKGDGLAREGLDEDLCVR
jgi:hypothetical protein